MYSNIESYKPNPYFERRMVSRLVSYLVTITLRLLKQKSRDAYDSKRFTIMEKAIDNRVFLSNNDERGYRSIA
jgi:hypothetical protein